jgi:tetratricopeptide (TPR) repeat protein
MTLLGVALVACTSRGSRVPVSETTTEPRTIPLYSDVATGDIAMDAIWNDPGFKRAFVAGYGVNAEIEPRVSQEEILILEKIRPLMAEGNLSGAETLLRTLMKPNCAATLDFTLGSIQFQQDRMDDALANFEAAVNKFPTFRRAWRNLGLIHVRASRHENAIRSFTRMIELGGGDGYAYGLLGFSHAAREDYQPAEASYRNALLLQPENTEWRLGLARCVFKQEKFQDAATLLDALLARYPENADFWLLQAQTFMGMKQSVRAAENLEIVDRLGKSTTDSLFTLGEIYAHENLADLSAGAFARAIKADERQPFARPIRSAELLAGKGASSAARRVTNQIRETCGQHLQDGDRRRLLKLEARISMAEGGSTSDAVTVLEEILTLDPLDGEALMLLGQHYAKSNDREKAIFYYERAAGIEAVEVDAKTRHAQVLVAMGRYSDALPLLRRAQEVKPRETVARYIEQVERISKSKK